MPKLLLMCLMFHIRVKQLFAWYAKKEKHFHKISVCFHKNFFPDLPNLDAQIRCAQNWYTSVQTDLNHPLSITTKCNLQ